MATRRRVQTEYFDTVKLSCSPWEDYEDIYEKTFYEGYTYCINRTGCLTESRPVITFEFKVKQEVEKIKREFEKELNDDSLLMAADVSRIFFNEL